eukprot:scaffold268324_cov31-Tisochrysis_lutea.AAC.4
MPSLLRKAAIPEAGAEGGGLEPDVRTESSGMVDEMLGAVCGPTRVSPSENGRRAVPPASIERALGERGGVVPEVSDNATGVSDATGVTKPGGVKEPAPEAFKANSGAALVESAGSAAALGTGVLVAGIPLLALRVFGCSLLAVPTRVAALIGSSCRGAGTAAEARRGLSVTLWPVEWGADVDAEIDNEHGHGEASGEVETGLACVPD